MESKATKEEAIKAMIELAKDFEDADRIIVEYLGLKTAKEKRAWVKENWPVSILVHENETSDELAYFLLLTTVVEVKWLPSIG